MSFTITVVDLAERARAARLLARPSRTGSLHDQGKLDHREFSQLRYTLSQVDLEAEDI
jgi:hypothetical protein